ncbi:hypothetical protein, partial [Gordonia sp. i37]|uniref:hypothetical protein n=1 Tax=Gordonia sp. i37 TaxID=1961707 RepID=UPI0009D465E7
VEVVFVVGWFQRRRAVVSRRVVLAALARRSSTIGRGARSAGIKRPVLLDLIIRGPALSSVVEV